LGGKKKGHPSQMELCFTCPDQGCADKATCKHDQEEWCYMQSKLMQESDEARRDALTWDFILSFQPLMRHLILKRKEGWMYSEVETDDLANHANWLFFRRFKKALSNGKYKRITRLKGYLNKCIAGEIIRLSNIYDSHVQIKNMVKKLERKGLYLNA